jgi:hypothetical protein
MYDLCLAEYKELWRVVLAEYIDVEVQKRLSVGGGFPCLEGFSFSGTWCVQRIYVYMAERLSGHIYIYIYIYTTHATQPPHEPLTTNALNLLTNPSINLLNLLNLLYLYIWPNAYQGSPPHCVPSFPLPFVGLLAAAL